MTDLGSGAGEEFDPFVRGPFPVGVRSGQLVDSHRDDRQLAFEVWYPAASRYFGLDLSPVTQDGFSVLLNSAQLRQAAVRDAAIQPGRYPLLVYSHTSLGHRRQSSFLLTHLASHGYIVAAADHTGNTFGDLAARASTGTTLSPQEREALISADHRRSCARRALPRGRTTQADRWRCL